MTTIQLLQASITHESLKHHFRKIMDQHEVNMHDDEGMLNEDIVKEYLEAAKFSNLTFGTKYRTFFLEQWIELKNGNIKPL